MNTAAEDMALDLDLTYWLEMSEALAYQDTYAAAASKPGNPTGATTAPVGGAIAFGLTAIDFGFFNRVVGLGTAQPAPEADAKAASGFFLDLGVTQSVIHVAPGAEPTELVPWANARGYVKGARWVKTWRRLDEVPVPVPSLRIERIDASQGQVFGDVCFTAFEMPTSIHDIASATVGRPGWVHYLGFDGDTPVSTSAMHLTDGVAWFGYGGTLDAFRGRGWQSAMFARRLQDARDLGCRLAITAPLALPTARADHPGLARGVRPAVSQGQRLPADAPPRRVQPCRRREGPSLDRGRHPR